LKFLVEAKINDCNTPTIREIAKGINSYINMVQRHVNKLVGMELLNREKGKTRSLTVNEENVLVYYEIDSL